MLSPTPRRAAAAATGYPQAARSMAPRHWLAAWTEALFVASEKLAVDHGHAAFTGTREPGNFCAVDPVDPTNP